MSPVITLTRWHRSRGVSTPHRPALRHVLKGTQQRLRISRTVPVLRLPLIPESLIDAAGGLSSPNRADRDGAQPGARASRHQRTGQWLAPTGASTHRRALGTDCGHLAPVSLPSEPTWGDLVHARSDQLTDRHRRLPPPRSRGRLALCPQTSIGDDVEDFPRGQPAHRRPLRRRVSGRAPRNNSWDGDSSPNACGLHPGAPAEQLRLRYVPLVISSSWRAAPRLIADGWEAPRKLVWTLWRWPGTPRHSGQSSSPDHPDPYYRVAGRLRGIRRLGGAPSRAAALIGRATAREWKPWSRAWMP